MSDKSLSSNAPNAERDAEQVLRQDSLWGQISLCVGLVMSLVFPAYLSFVKSYHPGWAAIGKRPCRDWGCNWYHGLTLLMFLQM